MNLESYHESVFKCIFSFLEKIPPSILNKLDYIKKGKLVRSNILYDLMNILGKNPQEIVYYAAIVESIHFVSILQDDIIDEEHTRRNSKTLNSQYNYKTTVLTSSLFLSNIFKNLTSHTQNKTIIKEIYKKVHQLCEGEIIQDLSNIAYKIQTPESNIEIINKKTGSLFALSFIIPPILFKIQNYELYEKIGYLYGLFFQVHDDFLDIIKDSKQLLKKQGLSQLSIVLSFWKNNDHEHFHQFIQTKDMTILQQRLPHISKSFSNYIDGLLNDLIKTIEEKNDPLLHQTLDLFLKKYPRFKIPEVSI